MHTPHRTPLDHLALEAQDIVSGSNVFKEVRETVFDRLPYPGNCTTRRLKHTPVLNMKKFLFFLSWGQLTHPEAIERLSGNMGRGIHYVGTLTWHHLVIIVAH